MEQLSSDQRNLLLLMAAEYASVRSTSSPWLWAGKAGIDSAKFAITKGYFGRDNYLSNALWGAASAGGTDLSVAAGGLVTGALLGAPGGEIGIFTGAAVGGLAGAFGAFCSIIYDWGVVTN